MELTVSKFQARSHSTTPLAIAAASMRALTRAASSAGASSSGESMRSIFICADRSAKTLHDVRADQVGEPERHPLPEVDEQPVFWVERIHLGYGFRVHQQVLVVQRLRLESPVLLEIEGPGAPLAASVVEYLQSA